MPTYLVNVIELRSVRCEYLVEADSEWSARERAAVGDTISSTDTGEPDEVIDRTVYGDVGTVTEDEDPSDPDPNEPPTRREAEELEAALDALTPEDMAELLDEAAIPRPAEPAGLRGAVLDAVAKGLLPRRHVLAARW